ncbi:hypothetical protein QBC34DRAFT_34339 [Podospora aff. communis PSN243]|uniref:Uncharacterized protein n=1 Tax=Podospora aff. communis PSN243 TaxID=3040156 RepID=A0AAV9H0J0_9PEZI|nr:hypothetical protein QBC34DRAFT_34339 [Podospora aff. communis PSN243]
MNVSLIGKLYLRGWRLPVEWVASFLLLGSTPFPLPLGLRRRKRPCRDLVAPRNFPDSQPPGHARAHRRGNTQFTTGASFNRDTRPSSASSPH